MKKMTFIAAICLVLAATISAQTITPMQLKQARMSAYQWVRDYNVYARMEGKREPARKFISLFEEDATMLFNDYLPLIYAKGNKISVREYASILANKEAIYKMSFQIQNVTIISEELKEDGNIEFVVEFDKVVSFQERGNNSDDLYAYPDKKYHAAAYIAYNIREEKAIAQEIISDENIEEIIILHDAEAEFVNQYTSKKKLEKICHDNATALVKWNYASTDFDPQMVYLTQDTVRNSFHFGAAIGLSTHTSKTIDGSFTDYSVNAGLNYGFSFGYYRQLKLRDKHRLGIDLSLAFSQSTIGLNASTYKDTYNSTDTNGGDYLRIIELSSYKETLKRYALRVPIALRYDYFFKNNLSLYTKLGVDFSYDVYQTANATAHVQYSGYYDWLFHVTLSQNGIYDFGAYDIKGRRANDVGINRLGVGIFTGVGIQYFIPRSQWSIDAVIFYECEAYNKISNPQMFHLTETYTDWKSASYLLKSFYGHNIQLQMNFNYNF